MKTYNLTFILDSEEIYKDIQASSIDDAKVKAADPAMWPNEFFHNYESMIIAISYDGNEVAAMTYKDFSVQHS